MADNSVSGTRLKIAFVAHDRPNYHGGPIVNVRRLLPEFQRHGHEPMGLFFHQEGQAPTADLLSEMGIPCRCRAFRGTSEDRIDWLLTQLEDFQPDVYVPNLSVSASYAARWAREAGMATISVVRGDDSFWWDMVKQFIAGPPAWAVSGAVCTSQDLQRRIETLAPRQTKVAWIPSGVPLPCDSVAAHAPFRICYVGRLTDDKKNIQRILDVFYNVVRARPDASATFLGDGPAKEKLVQRVAEQALQNRIEFAGHIAADQLAQRLTGMSVVLLMSDSEGTPGGLMEPMAGGIVPVCWDIPGGVRELVQHEQTGLLTAPTVAAATEAVLQLADDTARWSELSRQARAHIAENYALDRTVERWLEFCQTLVSEAGERRPLRRPRYYRLPPIMPALAVEDRRRISPWQHCQTFLYTKARGAVRRLKKLVGVAPRQVT